MSRQPIKVLIVDDSAVVRQVLTTLLARQPGIEVIGSASDPIFAMEKMQRQWPDVLVLDVEMPRMDGITFLRKIMATRPTPVVICSTLTERTSESGLQALAAGAVELVTKPRSALKGFLEDDSGEIIAAVRAAAVANLQRVSAAAVPPYDRCATLQMAQPPTPTEAQAMAATTDRIVAIGTSTGGTQALEVVLRTLTRACPGVVIVQHMPEKFTGAFARRLDQLCSVEVLEAGDGDRILPGRALIAPGGRHMSVRRSGAQYHVEVRDGPLVNRHRPSVDVLFRSVARSAGANALGIIMTGMGDDGARGLKEMHDAGARTAAQDEASCVVWGMPKEAVRLGATDHQLPLQAIAGLIERYARCG